MDLPDCEMRKGMALAEDVEDVFTHFHMFSTLALLQEVSLDLSAPKHKVGMGLQEETQNFCCIWSPWRWAPVLLSPCFVPCALPSLQASWAHW